MDDFTSIEQALTAIHQVVDTIGDNDLHRATPCPEFDIATLADHLVDTIARLGAAADIPVTLRDDDSIDGRIETATHQVLDGWRRRGLSEPVAFSGRRLSGELALGIVSLELVVHGWDFAVALGERLQVSDTHATHVLSRALQTLTEQSRAVAGFGPPVPVGDDAGPLDLLVAFTGRDPRCLGAHLHAGMTGPVTRAPCRSN
jgi:uncharacterized protein (TIGR03086 family)